MIENNISVTLGGFLIKLISSNNIKLKIYIFGINYTESEDLLHRSIKFLRIRNTWLHELVAQVTIFKLSYAT